MRPSLRRGLLPTALAGLAVVAGANVAAGSADRAPARDAVRTVAVTPPSIDVPGVKVKLPSISTPSDVIEVAGKKCPKGHPRKVGTSSSSSSTQVNGGPVRRKERHVLLCAR
jgi:hypothetical protein